MTDGRVARRQRNQDTVLDAVVALFDAGRVEPGVDEVSELSGVSTRSIYRYFHHRDGLIEAALWHLVARVEAELVLHLGDGVLSERVRAFVEHRLAVFSRIAPLVRASKRLARPLAVEPQPEVQPDIASAHHEQRGEGSHDDRIVIRDADRTLFAIDPSVAFARDFEGVDPVVRNIAAISADVMFRFDTLDGLAEALASDSTMMKVVLERHLRQQIAPV